MRRRLRRQQRVREALLIDLGALVFELHRQGRREPELLQAKAAELTTVDEEVRGLSEALGGDGTVLELVAAGIAGSCSQCGALMSTDARFCSSCGAPASLSLGTGAANGAAGWEHEVPAPEQEQALPEEPEPSAEIGTEEHAVLEAGAPPVPPPPEPELDPEVPASPLQGGRREGAVGRTLRRFGLRGPNR